MRPRFSILYALAALVTFTGATAAQAPPPVLNFSRISGAFDGNPPVGARFEIRGTVEASVQSVRLEVLGFPAGEVPREFREAPSDVEFCAALDRARNRHDVVSRHVVAWDRSTPDARVFSVFQPPLFFGRQYVFLFSYFTRTTEAAASARLEAEFTRAMTGVFSARGIAQGLTAERARDVLLQAMPASSCRAFVDPRAGRDADLMRDLLDASADVLDDIVAEAARRRFSAELVAEQAATGAELRQSAGRTSLRGREHLPGILALVEGGRFEQAQDTIDALRQRRAEYDTATFNALYLRLGRLRGLADDANTPAESIADLTGRVMSRIGDAGFSEVLAATTVMPTFQTTTEAQAFLLSLDGGLIYVGDFKELLPALAVNIKLNRVDFEDPLSRTPEFSLLAGFNLAAPDDLDPDYRGLFGANGQRAFVTGFGIRFPSISPLLRAQVGTVWYRQVDANPLVRDLRTRVSGYLGVSANWDALDLASRLISGRRTLSLGSQ